jgi:hypothetical protein
MTSWNAYNFPFIRANETASMEVYGWNRDARGFFDAIPTEIPKHGASLYTTLYYQTNPRGSKDHPLLRDNETRDLRQPFGIDPMMEGTLLAALDLPVGGRRTRGRRGLPPTVGSPGPRRSAT